MARYAAPFLVVLFAASIVGQVPPDQVPKPYLRLGSLQLRHSLPATFVGFPDNKTVVSFGLDDTIRIWESATGNQIREIKLTNPWKDLPYDGRIYRHATLALSPDCQSLVTCYQDDTIRCWDLGTGKELTPLKGIGGAIALAFSPDGRYVAGAIRDDKVHIWDWKTKEWLRAFGETQKWRWLTVFNTSGELIFAPDSKSLVAILGESPEKRIGGVFNAILQRWEVETGKDLGAIHRPADNYAASPVFSADGKRLMFSTIGGNIVVIDLDSGKEVWQVQCCEHGLSALVLSPDKRRLYSQAFDNPFLCAFDPETGKELARFGPPNRLIGYMGRPSIAVSPDGKFLAAIGNGHDVQLVNSTNGMAITESGPHRYPVVGLNYTPDGKKLLSLSVDRTICLWDPDSGKLAKQWNESSEPTSFAITTDGAVAATRLENGNILLTSTGTRKQLATIEVPVGSSTKLEFSPDGKTLAVWVNTKTTLYDIPSGRKRCVLPGPYHNESIREGFNPIGGYGVFFFSPDSKLITAQGGDQDWMVICDTSTGKLISEFKFVDFHRVHIGAFSADHRTLAFDLANGRIGFWESATGQMRGLVDVEKSDPDRAPLVGPSVEQTIVYSPDGRFIAHVGAGDNVRLWNAVTGKVISTISTGQGYVTALTYSPDSRSLVTAGTDTTIAFWKLPSAEGAP